MQTAPEISPELFWRTMSGYQHTAILKAAVELGLEVVHLERPLRIDRPTPWDKVRELLAGFDLAGLASGIQILLARRKPPERNYRYLGNLPQGVGPYGEDAVQFLAQASPR